MKDDSASFMQTHLKDIHHRIIYNRKFNNINQEMELANYVVCVT